MVHGSAGVPDYGNPDLYLVWMYLTIDTLCGRYAGTGCERGMVVEKKCGLGGTLVRGTVGGLGLRLGFLGRGRAE